MSAWTLSSLRVLFFFSCSSDGYYDGTLDYRVATSCGWAVRGSNCGRSQLVFLVSKSSRPALGPTEHAVQWVRRSIGRGTKLTAHLCLALRLKVSGAVPLLTLYAFMAWTGTALPLPYRFRNVVSNSLSTIK